MSNTKQDELRENILRKGIVRKGVVIYEDTNPQDIVRIGIDDLMQLIHADRVAHTNQLLDKVEQEAPKDVKQTQPSFMSAAPWPPINEVEAINANNAQWRKAITKVRETS